MSPRRLGMALRFVLIGTQYSDYEVPGDALSKGGPVSSVGCTTSPATTRCRATHQRDSVDQGCGRPALSPPDREALHLAVRPSLSAQ